MIVAFDFWCYDFETSSIAMANHGFFVFVGVTGVRRGSFKLKQFSIMGISITSSTNYANLTTVHLRYLNLHVQQLIN